MQITSGKGPAECCRVVALVQQMIVKQVKQQGISTAVLDEVPAEHKGASLSSTLMIESDNLAALIQEWSGTIQWIAQSPYRANHKRKNWFIGIAVFDIKELGQWDLKDVSIETTKASGPGGQNVNKLETAVRATHQPSGIKVMAMDSRSQLENKKLALSRLQAKVLAWQANELMEQQQDKWLKHHSLERGNPVKTIRGSLF